MSTNLRSTDEHRFWVQPDTRCLVERWGETSSVTSPVSQVATIREGMPQMDEKE
jgi:hypothetical protein